MELKASTFSKLSHGQSGVTDDIPRQPSLRERERFLCVSHVFMSIFAQLYTIFYVFLSGLEQFITFHGFGMTLHCHGKGKMEPDPGSYGAEVTFSHNSWRRICFITRFESNAADPPADIRQV